MFSRWRSVPSFGSSRVRRVMVPSAVAFLAGCVHSADAPTTPAPTPPEVVERVDAEPEDTSEAPTSIFDARAFARSYVSTRVSLFTPSASPREALERSVRGVRNATTRRTIRRALVIVHLLAADAATEPSAREEERRAMQREARLALRGNRDPQLAAEMAFVDVWLAWTSNTLDAARKAEAFATRHVVDHELTRVVTLIRAELSLDHESDVRARELLSTLRGDIRDPLHAYASYEIARSYCEDAEDERCNAGLRETRLLGCAPDAGPETRAFAERAFADLREPVVPRRERVRGAPRYCSRAASEMFGDPDVVARTPPT